VSFSGLSLKDNRLWRVHCSLYNTNCTYILKQNPSQNPYCEAQKQNVNIKTASTRSRASTSTYSLTFRVRHYAIVCTDCHSNETRTPIANPPNSTQLGAPLPYLKVTSGSVQ